MGGKTYLRTMKNIEKACWRAVSGISASPSVIPGEKTVVFR